MKLTPKENSLLTDLKSGEELCIKRYEKSSKIAYSPELKQLFTKLEQKEKEHLKTINEIISGAIPTMPAKKKPAPKPTYKVKYDEKEKKEDAYLCSDSLSAEKHISSVYDVSIFEFKNKELRDILNHIQKEEQEHGENIYDYMEQCKMYA